MNAALDFGPKNARVAFETDCDVSRWCEFREMG